MAAYFYEASHEDWSLDGLAEWCAINISCDKKKLLDSMKKVIQDMKSASISEAARLKANSLQEKLEENLREIKEKEAIQLAQIKSHETVQLAEIKSKNLQEHTVTVMNFHKNIANDLTTVDRKRKESEPNKDEELTPNERRTCDYSSGSESEENDETEKVDDDSDDWGEIINCKDFSFDVWIDTYTLIKITRQKIEEANQLAKTIPRPTVNRKIDLRVLSIDSNVDLSHSEFACKATPIKVIKDRSKCIRTNKCILDAYLMHNLPEEAIENSTFYGLQSA
ncbi:9404_t:CDS:2, partial [Racocetra fulgida]